MRAEVITDITDLLKLQESLRTNQTYCFRGQSDARWNLIPSMFRSLVGVNPPINGTDAEWIARSERDIYREFHRSSKPHIDNIDQWELLCIAQHYGVPTRLLDWTRNLLVATYFALTNADADNVAVWCMNLSDLPFPASLGRQVPKGAFRLDNIRHYATTFQPSFFQKVSRPRVSTMSHTPNGTLIIFEVPSLVPRIEHQEGLFSVYLSFDDDDLVWDHSDYILQVERNYGLELLVKIIIPKPHTYKVRRQLEQAGYNLYRLFPDLVGLGMLLRDEHSNTFKEYLDTR